MALSDSAGVGSALPSQVGVTSGWALTTDGTKASWAAVSGGSGVTTMAAVGSSPSANGASIAGVTLTLQPADATHPGLLTTAAQTIAGAKTFSTSVLSDLVAGKTAGATNFSLGSTGGFPGAWFGVNADTPSAVNPSLLLVPVQSEMRFGSTDVAFGLGFYLGGTEIWKMNVDGSLECVVASSTIKMKDTVGGTVRTIQVTAGVLVVT